MAGSSSKEIHRSGRPRSCYVRFWSVLASVWTSVQQRISGDKSPQNITALEKIPMEEWTKISSTVFENLLEAYRKPLTSVLKTRFTLQLFRIFQANFWIFCSILQLNSLNIKMTSSFYREQLRESVTAPQRSLPTRRGGVASHLSQAHIFDMATQGKSGSEGWGTNIPGRAAEQTQQIYVDDLKGQNAVLQLPLPGRCWDAKTKNHIVLLPPEHKMCSDVSRLYWVNKQPVQL